MKVNLVANGAEKAKTLSVRVRNWRGVSCHALATLFRHPVIASGGQECPDRPGVWMNEFIDSSGHSLWVGFDHVAKRFILFQEVNPCTRTAC